MRWQQFQIEICSDQLDAVEAIFLEAGALAVSLSDSGDDPVLEPAPGELRVWPNTTLTALFEDDGSLDARRALLARELPPDALDSLQAELIADRAWEREWLKDFKPMRFGKRLWVCPTGMTSGVADALELALDPGLAFGTGTHATTALCLEWLEQNPPRRESVIDFGCGSGILAIAASLLGAASVTATDIDPQALAATVSNAQLNGVSSQIVVRPVNDIASSPVDLLLANILAATLIELRCELTERVRIGGRVALSGILTEQAETVLAAYATSFSMDDPIWRDGWVLLTGTRAV